MSSIESMMMNPEEGPKINPGSVELHALKNSGTNFAFAVIVLLGQVGIGRAANNIQDKANEQRQLAKGQGLLSNVSQFFSLLEGNTSWKKDSTGLSHAYWPQGFQQNNMSSFADMIRSYDQLFWNGSVSTSSGAGGASNSWVDNSVNSSDMNVFIQLPKAISLPGGGSIPRGTTIGLNPCSGAITVNGTLQSATSPDAKALKPMMDNVTKFFKTGIEQMLDVNDAQADEILYGGKSGPNSKVHTVPRFLTMLSSELQSNIDDTPESAMSSLMTKGSGLQNWFGSVLADPTMSALHGLYNLLNTTTVTVGEGSEMKPGEYSINDMMKNVIYYMNYSNHMKYDAKGVTGVMWDALGKMMSDYESSKMSGTKASVQSTSADERLDKLPYIEALSANGLFNETQSSLQQATSTLQSQSQQTAASLQQESSVLTSYDQIGQSMITALNKSLQTMVQNLKGS